MNDALVVLGVAVLGGIGAVARFLLDGWVQRDRLSAFPFGTLAVNLTGSFVLGVLAGAALDGDALVLAGTATLGSFTTFSTWMLEAHRLGEDGELRMAGSNLAVSLALGLAAAGAGLLAGGAVA